MWLDFGTFDLRSKACAKPEGHAGTSAVFLLALDPRFAILIGAMMITADPTSNPLEPPAVAGIDFCLATPMLSPEGNALEPSLRSEREFL
jgi:hypothetical protein